MTVTAIIAEYNPFHNGHAYQIRQARSAGSSVIVLMSGDFVQRGEPAVTDKFMRARCALECGADAVFELPLCHATASAEGFAFGGVSLANALGCVNTLCFGSECGDLGLLCAVANILAGEPAIYQEALRAGQKNGLPFPAAREQALRLYFEENKKGKTCDERAIPALLSQPNNILAIEYLKALKKTGSRIRPVTIKRQGAGYHSLEIDGQFCSASALRALLRDLKTADQKASADWDAASLCMPAASIDSIRRGFGQSLPLFTEDFSALLHYALLRAADWEALCACAGVSEELARRIFSLIPQYESYNSFVSLVKTRNITETAVRRALLHILLDLRKQDVSGEGPYFARLLGFHKASPVLPEIKKSSRIPVLTKPANACSILTDVYSGAALQNARRQFDDTVRGSEIYHAVLRDKFGGPAYSEYRQSPVIL